MPTTSTQQVDSVATSQAVAQLNLSTTNSDERNIVPPSTTQQLSSTKALTAAEQLKLLPTRADTQNSVLRNVNFNFNNKAESTLTATPHTMQHHTGIMNELHDAGTLAASGAIMSVECSTAAPRMHANTSITSAQNSLTGAECSDSVAAAAAADTAPDEGCGSAAATGAAGTAPRSNVRRGVAAEASSTASSTGVDDCAIGTASPPPPSQWDVRCRGTAGAAAGTASGTGGGEYAAKGYITDDTTMTDVESGDESDSDYGDSDCEDGGEVTRAARVDFWTDYTPEEPEPPVADANQFSVTTALISDYSRDDLLTDAERNFNCLHVAEMQSMREQRIGSSQWQQRGLQPGHLTCHGGIKMLFNCSVDRRRGGVEPPVQIKDGSYDSGCGASCIDEAQIKLLLHQCAIHADAVFEMEHPRILAGFDTSRQRTKVRKAVLLHITFVAVGRTPVKLAWIFLVVPNLGASMLLGGDVIGLHNINQRLGDKPGIIDIEFLPGPKTWQAQCDGGSTVPVLRVRDGGDTTERWRAVVARTAHVNGDRDRWVSLRICHADGKTPVQPGDPGTVKDMSVEVRVDHGGLQADRITVGLTPTGAVPVVLRSLGGDIDLQPAQSIGRALAMEDTPISERSCDEFGSPMLSNLRKPKAMERFCGAGGLSEGAKPFVHTVLASDISERACKLFASNHCGTTVMPANINDRSAQLHIIAEARRLGVEVSSGGPPCTDFSMSGKRCSQKGIQCIISMLQV
ncbi:hypothetical protein JKP88DRAFT_252566 [Tribonema minus]|uniref:Uncharacterized protein n=1 Tax=Tribonema minus TaxID=303371 RepID=A0A835ZBG8_9STRA|nr:hypothetical protein JKP88DRAFT_252566 [Tribonema minus]